MIDDSNRYSEFSDKKFAFLENGSQVNQLAFETILTNNLSLDNDSRQKSTFHQLNVINKSEDTEENEQTVFINVPNTNNNTNSTFGMMNQDLSSQSYTRYDVRRKTMGITIEVDEPSISSRESDNCLLMSNANDAHLIYKLAGTVMANSDLDDQSCN